MVDCAAPGVGAWQEPWGGTLVDMGEENVVW